MEGTTALRAARIALAVFVLAWLLGPSLLRDVFPVWFVFLLAVGLELHFFLGSRRVPPRSPDRGPQAADVERYGYDGDDEEPPEDDEELLEDEGEEEEGEPELEPEPPRRRLPLRALATVGLVAAALAGASLWESRTGWSGLDAAARAEAVALFSAEASRVAGKPVQIRCDERGEHVGAVQRADGIAIVGGRLAYLTPQRCHDLYRLAFAGEDRGSQTARALTVLAHEAWHLHGIRDEGVTECYALQSAVGIGERLGLSGDRARQLLRQQLTENALRRRGSAEYLVPAECRDGGRLDLDPASSRFP